jgi:hypothetical protein
MGEGENAMFFRTKVVHLLQSMLDRDREFVSVSTLPEQIERIELPPQKSDFSMNGLFGAIPGADTGPIRISPERWRNAS